MKLSKILVDEHSGKIPKNFADLTALPGVGNKTASVYQNAILKLPRVAVDTHVFRVSNRIGLTKTKTTDLTQIKLEKTIPKKWLIMAHHLLILHGRRICKAQKPLCHLCFCHSEPFVINVFCHSFCHSDHSGPFVIGFPPVQ